MKFLLQFSYVIRVCIHNKTALKSFFICRKCALCDIHTNQRRKLHENALSYKKLMEIKMLVCICKKENVKLNVAVNVSSNFVLKVVIKDHPMQCLFLIGWSLISNFFPR